MIAEQDLGQKARSTVRLRKGETSMLSVTGTARRRTDSGHNGVIIDVSRFIEQFEYILRSDEATGHEYTREDILSVLVNWQYDEMLDRASRQRAKQLFREFRRPQVSFH